MKRETMKTVVLIILIAFSLVLTVALWNYQPVAESDDSENTLIDDTTLDNLGQERTLSELIEPEKVVFHDQGNFYAYKEELERSSFYKDMQEWTLNNLNVNPKEISADQQKDAVEVIFPAQVPVKVIGDLFQVDKEQIENVRQKFDRVFLTAPQGEKAPSYQVWFVNTEEQAPVLRATINSADGDRAFRELEDEQKLNKQLRLSDAFPNADTSAYDHIYIPEKRKNIEEYVLQTDPVPIATLRNALFPSTSLVSRYKTSSGEPRFRASEGRRLDVLDGDRRMEYLYMIPNSVNSGNLDGYELLRRSITDVNGHLGWTNQFQLVSNSSDMVQYRMKYNDIPVMEGQGTYQLATIALSYEQDEIQRYIRPLVKFKTISETIGALESGEEVVRYLQNNNIDYASIQDIRISYTLEERTNRLAYNLIPEWYIQTSSGWQPLFERNQGQNEEIS
ncbi:YycH family regulatory protein [Halobacillus sp. KGW1]|uniref:YycH family regulatory protein n=1 Tax=Halobacillus sp. KGW1 TaxID=1793726 RepID=UPI0007841C10|nr:two-component system activity regulator YycH [Halobacillus sp. KGW1]